MQLDLRHRDVRGVARLWRQMDEVRGETPEKRIAHLLEGLCVLLGADDACWVSAIRRPRGGYRGWVVPRVQYRFQSDARQRIAEQGAAMIERGRPDVVTVAWAASIGRSRAIRRNDLVPESEWRRDDFLDSAARALRVSDRLQGASTGSPTAEATLLVDRRTGGTRFSKRQVDLLYLFVSGFERETRALIEAADPAPRRLSVRAAAPGGLQQLGSALEAPESTLRWRAVDLILRATADESFHADDLARSLGMSRSSLERFVRAGWGTSPGMLIRQIRLDMAAELLATSGAPIAAIAVCAGYGGAAQFTRAFRSHFGVAPTEWRRRAVSPD